VNADRSSQRLTLALRDALPISMISLCARFISRKLYGAAAAMFVLSILAGCGGNPSQAPEEYGFGQLGAPAPYLIGPGDSLEIFRSEEHTSELQSREKLVCRLLL